MAETVSDNRSAWEEYRAEAASLWRSMPNKGMFGILLVAWMGLFQFLGNSTMGYVETNSLFGWMYYVYSSSPDDGHGMFIPFVVLALFWWKREELRRVEKRLWWPGTVLVGMGLVLHLLGYAVQQNRVSIVGLFVGLYGLMGVAWGWKFLKVSFFPFFLFAFCLPLGTVADSITVPLRLMVSAISAGIADVGLGVDVVRQGTQIFDPKGDFKYDVAAACSGIRSLTVLFAVTTIYGFMMFETWWKRAAIVLAAIPLAIAGNVARLTGVIITAEAFGEDAGMTFHDHAGFVTFVVAIGGVIGLSALLKEDSGVKPNDEAAPVGRVEEQPV